VYITSIEALLSIVYVKVSKKSHPTDLEYYCLSRTVVETPKYHTHPQISASMPKILEKLTWCSESSTGAFVTVYSDICKKLTSLKFIVRTMWWYQKMTAKIFLG